MRSAIVAFLWGCVVTGTTGYYLVHQDIYRANGAIYESIGSLKDKISGSEAALEKRVDALENMVQELAATSKDSS